MLCWQEDELILKNEQHKRNQGDLIWNQGDILLEKGKRVGSILKYTHSERNKVEDNYKGVKDNTVGV